MSNKIPLPEVLAGASNLSILHHWDADGIASASRIISWASERGIDFSNKSPKIGAYSSIVCEVIELSEGNTDAIIGLDLALSEEMVRKIEKSISKPVIWFDHHANPPSPTTIQYKHPSNTLGYHIPSNSWFIDEIFGDGPGLLGAIGAYGDLGTRVNESPYNNDIVRIVKQAKIQVEDLLEIVDLIDANYRSNDINGVRKGPQVLIDNLQSPQKLLNIKNWRKNRRTVETEISRIFHMKPTHMGDFLIREIDTRMHLTSIIARISAVRAHREKAVVVYNVHRDEVPFYVRGVQKGLDLTPLIRISREMGFSSGGKTEVVGMVVSKSRLEEALEMTMKLLEAKL